MCLPEVAAAASFGATAAEGFVQRAAIKDRDRFNRAIAARNRELLLERHRINQRALSRRQLEISQQLGSTIEELQRQVTGARAQAIAQASTTGTAGTSVLEVNDNFIQVLLRSEQNARRNAAAEQVQIQEAKKAQNIDLAQALLASAPPPLTAPSPFAIALSGLANGLTAYFQAQSNGS